MPQPQPRKLIITLEEEINLRFLAEHPCSTDRVSLFGRLDRTRLHYLISERDPLVGKHLSEITRFFLDKTNGLHAADDSETNGMMVEEGQQQKAQWKRFLTEHFGGL